MGFRAIIYLGRSRFNALEQHLAALFSGGFYGHDVLLQCVGGVPEQDELDVVAMARARLFHQVFDIPPEKKKSFVKDGTLLSPDSFSQLLEHNVFQGAEFVALVVVGPHGELFGRFFQIQFVCLGDDLQGLDRVHDDVAPVEKKTCKEAPKNEITKFE